MIKNRGRLPEIKRKAEKVMLKKILIIIGSLIGAILILIIAAGIIIMPVSYTHLTLPTNREV